MAATSAADGSTWSSMTSTPTTRGRSPPAPAFSGNPTTTATATADTVPATSKETSGASVPAPFHSTGAGRAPGTQPTPLQVLRGSRQLTAHRRQRDVDDRIVHHHQQDAQAQDRQDPPAPAVNIGASRADDAHGPAPAAAVVVTRPQCPAGRTGPVLQVRHGIAPFRVRRLAAARPSRSRIVKTKLAAETLQSAPPGGRCWSGCHGVLITGLQWPPGGGLLQEVPPGAARFIGGHRPGRMAARAGLPDAARGAARIRSADWPAG